MAAVVGDRRIGLVVIAVAVVAAGCTNDSPPTASDAPVTVAPTTEAPPTTEAAPALTTEAAPTTTEAPPTTEASPLAAADWTVQPGAEQVAALDAEPGTELELVDPQDAVVATGVVDELGSLLFRGVEPGPHVIRSDEQTTDTFTVMGLDDVPPDSFYAEQRLPTDGFGYLETRDGTTLSVNVLL